MSKEEQASPFAKFFNNDYLADCVLENTDPVPETHKAHKLVIAANSDYFFKFFQEHNTQEIQKITLPKFIKSSLLDSSQQNVFAKVLEFFYSNQTSADLIRIGLTKENAFAFLNHFTGLEANKGKALTQEFISKEVLNPTNCADCLFDAVKSNDEPLKEKCIETMVPIFSDLLNDSKQRLRLLGLPLQVFKDVLARDDLKVQNENTLLNLVIDYIQMKEELPSRPEPSTENKKEVGEVKAEEPQNEASKPEVEVENKPEEPKEPEEKKEEAPAPEQAEKKEEEPTENKPEDAPKEEGEKGEEKPVEEPKADEEKAPEAQEKEDKEVVNEKKKEENVPNVENQVKKVLDLEAEAQAKLQPYKLTIDEKRDLVKLLRLTYVTHESLIKAAGLPIFAEFKDIFIESLSAKLNTYETAHIEKYSINTNARAYTEPLSQSTVPNQGKTTSTAAQPNQLATPKDNKAISPNKQLPEQKSTPQKNNNVRPAGTNLTPQQAKNMTSHLSPPRKAQDLYHSTDYGHNRQLEHISAAPYSQTMGTMGQSMYQSVPRNYQSPPRDVFYNTSPNRMHHSGEKFYQNPGFKSNEQSQMYSSYQSAGSGKKDLIISPHKHLTSPMVFTYGSDFDENGAFYYLGTYGGQSQWQNPHEIGQVQAFFSSLGKGAVADLVGRDCVNCRTLNEPNSFMGVDLGVNRYLIPTCYTIRNRNSNHHVLLNWIFEASVDMKEWYCLDTRVHFTEDPAFNNMLETTREDLKQKGYMSTWGIDENQIEKVKKSIEGGNERFFGFRYFRITQTSKNSSGSYNLALSGLEVYGVAFGDNWLF